MNATTARSAAPRRIGSRAPVKLNVFAIPFGLAGLAGTWTAAELFLDGPAVLPAALWVVACLAWVATVLLYVYWSGGRAAIAADLVDPVLGPFAALVPITAMLLGARLSATFVVAGTAVVWISAAAAFGYGAWFTVRLLTAPAALDAIHPGYLLPTVAGGLLAAQSFGTVHASVAAMAAFGGGIFCWMLVGALLLVRFRTGGPLPDPLVPTLAIFSAPPAVAGNAWFALTGRAADGVQAALLGTFLLLVAVQVGLLPRYARLSFTPGFWAFTFTTAASATYALHWVTAADVPAWVSQAAGWGLVGVATAVIAAIAAVALRSLRPRVVAPRRLRS